MEGTYENNKLYIYIKYNKSITLYVNLKINKKKNCPLRKSKQTYILYYNTKYKYKYILNMKQVL